MSANKKKGNKPGKDNVEKFAPPPTENLILDNNILFEYSVSNDYQTICGAIDAGNHPISAYVIEQGLLKKRNEYGKTAFDLAASLGNKEFIRTLIERMGERPDDIASPFNLKQMIKQSNSYNFLHHACIWGRLDLCKLLIENSKLVTDPSVDENEFSSRSIDTFRSNKTTNPTTSLNQKPLGSVLLKSRCKTGETPLQLARRYNHLELIEYLVLAEKLQTFLDVLSDIKQFANDPEKNMNKLTKDDKKKIDRLYQDSNEWFDKNRENVDTLTIDQKIEEIESIMKPITEPILTLKPLDSFRI